MMNRRSFLGVALASAASSAFAAQQPQALTAAKSTTKARCLRLYHLHTQEHLEVDYRTGSYYHRGALAQLNEFLKDHRSGEKTTIDPRLFDTLYDLQQRLAPGDAEFQIVSAYRSPNTNAMLRRTSGGVARRSLHLTGQAIDIRLKGTPTSVVRDAALQLHQGGVGYYRNSNFVHIDTGQVRSWSA